MSSFLDKLNLRPQERRLVIVVFIVVFIVLNIWLVWPHFGDWSQSKANLQKAQGNIARDKAKIAQVKGPNGFEAQLKKLEGENEQPAGGEEQEIQLLKTVQNQVQQSKIMVSAYSPVTRSSSGTSTNEFFEEQSIRITINTGEKELVDFLLNIGSGSSMIRVRDMDLSPADQNRYRLKGTITLSANYQKKAPVKPAAAAPKSAAPVVKPPPAGAKKS